MPDRDSPTDRDAVERAVRSCYSTWSGRYYDDYYRGTGMYPPVHTDIVRDLLRRQVHAACSTRAVARPRCCATFASRGWSAGAST